MRRLLLTFAFLNLIAAPALADVGIEIQIDGEHEFFERCEYGFAHTDFGAGFSKIEFAYEKFIRGEKFFQCVARFGDVHDMTCDGLKGFEDDDHVCDELSIRAIGVRCYDASGSTADCGALKIRGSERFTFD